ncbi:MAG: helix-turn-helix domain-containing protein [Acidobacteria bacterium]|nr:helix-turn-helix domain-containing protein [Acidobacteriota bacterium]
MSDGFSTRLQMAFDQASMAEIARQIQVPHATVRNYFQGRMPAPEVLIKIANATNVSLNWLLTGAGEMYIPGARSIDLGQILEEKIGEIVDRKLARQQLGDVQELGRIDEAPRFDVREAVETLGDPHRVMSEWFRHEGREYPQDYGIVFFQGWETYSPEEKVEAVRDAKKVLDRTLRNKPS